MEVDLFFFNNLVMINEKFVSVEEVWGIENGVVIVIFDSISKCF